MITELENKLLFELKKEKYNLTKADIEHLEYIHQSRVFYNISDISNKFTVIELKGEKGFKANIKIKCVSQVVDVPCGCQFKRLYFVVSGVGYLLP